MPLAINLSLPLNHPVPNYIQVLDQYRGTAVENLYESVLLYASRTYRRTAGYFATARLIDIHKDLLEPQYLFLEIDQFRPLSRVIPTRDKHGHAHEVAGRGHDDKVNWWVYSAGLRVLSSVEWAAILHEEHPHRNNFPEGMPPRSGGEAFVDGADKLTSMNLTDTPQEPAASAGYIEVRRRKRAVLVRLQVLDIYGPSCAIFGPVEVSRDQSRANLQICHIVPLGKSGPDTPLNTFPANPDSHWDFDEGLISFADDGTILISRHASFSLQQKYAGIRARFPDEPQWRPARPYLDYHRTHIFEKMRPAQAPHWNPVGG